MKNELVDYVLHLADTSLIQGQRLGEWCGHAFVLEQDIAITNISLDLIGQSRSLYQYAAELLNDGRDEDALCMMRNEREFKNLLLVEIPNGDFAQTLARQFYFDVYHELQCQALLTSSDERLKAIAEKSLKEVRYHVTWSAEWVIRLGDGTQESHDRIQKSLNELWMWTAELMSTAPYERELIEKGIAPDSSSFKIPWMNKIKEILKEATLTLPVDETKQSGGKVGTHTEFLGFILADLQHIQRSYPGLTW